MNAETLFTRATPVTIEHQSLFDTYFAKYPQTICQMTFSNMFLWGQARSHYMVEVEGHLLVSFQKRGEERKWYPPIGPNPAHIIANVCPPTEGFRWFYVGKDVVEKLPPTITAREERDRFDYVYSLPPLRTLVGSRYMQKRNYIHRCLKHQPEIITLDATNVQECIQMLERWFGSGERPGMESAVDEISALHLIVQHFPLLHITGVGIRIAGQMEAFALGAPLSSTMFDELLEKSTNSVPGLYPLALHELAKRIPEQYTEVNREQDLGLPGLKTAKEDWHPLYLVEKFAIG